LPIRLLPILEIGFGFQSREACHALLGCVRSLAEKEALQHIVFLCRGALNDLQIFRLEFLRE